MKRFLSVLGLIILLCGAIGLYYYNKGHLEVDKREADIHISPQALLQDFDIDEAGANDKYLDKILKIEGIVQQINPTDLGSSLSLDAGNQLSSIICEFESADATIGILPGQKVIIKGYCTGKLLDVVLVRCAIIQK